jgi:putative heme-binding domain-containing protein
MKNTKMADGGWKMAQNRSVNFKTFLSIFFVSSCLRGSIAFAQPAPDPELERKSFTVADGFEVSLYAADPMMAKPIQMNFDPAGRLWVATSEIYPQIKPGQAADDKVLILEDTDRNHRADKVTVFARGLLIPTGVLPGDGGCYVANSTEIVHFKDTDGDGKADQRRVVLSGFGTEDTHHIIHTFRWGPDGNFYFNQSVYIHSHVETPWGPRILNAGGTWAYRPETQQFEVFSRGLINHWGHTWDKYGDSFMTDGAGDGGIHYAFPGVCFWSLNDQAPRILHPTEHGLNHGSPKFAGAEIISGRHFPDDWQGDVITNDFRANRVARFKLSEDGAGFASKLMPDVIRSTDKAFRPVDVKMGPDGALYIADWYNPIINHGEVDFRDPRRDKTHGRIWRLTAKGRPMVERPKLAGASVEALLDELKAPEDYTRRQARLALREMDKAAITAGLDKWVSGVAATDEFTRLQALWTYQTINVPRGELVRSLLDAKDPGVRVAATRVLGAWSAQVGPGVVDLLEKLVTDSHARVRLEAVRALATVKEPRAMEVALRVLDLPMDGFLDYALYLTANDLAPVWLPEFQAGRLTFGHNVKQVEFVLKAIRNPDAIRPLVEEFRAGKVSPESRRDVAELVASLGRPEDLAALFDAAVSNQTPTSTRVSLLQALERAARQRNVKAKSDVAALKPLLAGTTDDAVCAAALRLAGAMKLEQFRGDMTAWAQNPDRSLQIAAGIEALADLGGSESVKVLTRIATTGNPTRRLWASAALSRLDLKAASRSFAQALMGYGQGEVDLVMVLPPFLNRKDGPAALGAALGSEKLSQDTGKLMLRAVYALGHSEPALVDPLKAAAKIDSQPKQLTDDEMKQLIADVQAKGDAARGEAIFRRADTACLRCHSITGAGGTLAPDLVSAGSAPVDYLIDSILLPSKAIKEGYHTLIVETKDGDQITGIKVRQTDRDLILRDAVQDEVVVPLDSIKGKPREAGSMMPAGLADPLTRQELVDLVRFLSELGRPGPYAVGTQQLARRWQVLDPATHGIRPGQKLNVTPGALWMPAYSQVSGVLPPTGPSPMLARAQVNVTTPGMARLVLSAPPGSALWVDDNPVESKGDINVEMSRGTHSITVLPGGNGPLRLELTDAPGSAAKAQFVTGR